MLALGSNPKQPETRKKGRFYDSPPPPAADHRVYLWDCSSRYSFPLSTLRFGGRVTFQIGDKVIYPNHGLGVVQGIETKTILGTTCGFYHLRMVANETTVLVPVDNVDGVGLRRAIGDEEIERLFGLLGDGKIDNHQNWKGRFKDNSDRMRTGSIYDVVEVLKSLTFLAKSKNLSFREKRMLDRAKFLVISEISEMTRNLARSSMRFSRNERFFDFARNVRLFNTSTTS